MNSGDNETFFVSRDARDGHCDGENDLGDVKGIFGVPHHWPLDLLLDNYQRPWDRLREACFL